METRIDEKMAALRKAGRKGLIAYITAGDPNLTETGRILSLLEDAGVDAVELGIPFSDPLADGRVNQEAAARALAAGTRLTGICEQVAAFRQGSGLPILFFSYLNPLFAPGFERVVRQAARAGVDGMLILDLALEESRPYQLLLNAAGLHCIRLLAPTSTPERQALIVQGATGFLYVISRAGVTGMCRELPRNVCSRLRILRKQTSLPLALGFGVSTPVQAAAAAQNADAVVVGSALVARLHEAGTGRTGRATVKRWISELARAVHGN